MFVIFEILIICLFVVFCNFSYNNFNLRLMQLWFELKRSTWCWWVAHSTTSAFSHHHPCSYLVSHVSLLVCFWFRSWWNHNFWGFHVGNFELTGRCATLPQYFTNHDYLFILDIHTVNGVKWPARVSVISSSIFIITFIPHFQPTMLSTRLWVRTTRVWCELCRIQSIMLIYRNATPPDIVRIVP